MKLPLSRFALALFLVMQIGPACAEAHPGDLLRESIDRLGLQTEMPGSAMSPRTETQEPNQGPQTEMPDPPTRAPDDESNARVVADFVFWLLLGSVILGVIVISWSLRDSLPGSSRSRKIIAPAEVPPSPAPSNPLEEAQIEADDLARQGHYGEAMHLLLLKSLNEIRRQLGVSFAVSLTSREILRRLRLSEIGRQALAAIIRSVERTYFGGADAGESDYADCRGNFETLKHSLTTVATR